MNYTLSRILGWIADNKLSTFLGLCLFAFVISTIVLSSQKSSLQDQLDKCNAATEKPTDPTTTQAPDQTTTQAPDTTTTKAPDTTTTVAPTTTTTTLKPDPSKAKIVYSRTAAQKVVVKLPQQNPATDSGET
ncbi:uncharacterized protein LOC129578873 isoform X1 [Sitodiplosis mosellana]|uniref:uncharacterized protein LOC129578873 isoform X1 n=1 Tax=Sitodiplosis mosellana TaxID=263140 RepID=UPI0024450DDB|nr:uncharacterized protein LOC129578873 isoform X1 [Sitodiplosis mosellana]